MFRRLSKLSRAVEDARSALGPARERLDELLSAIAAARGDVTRVHEAGAALEVIAERKLYRVRDHASLAALLVSVGVSRTTAHKWRAIARTLSAEQVESLGVERAYELARTSPRDDDGGDTKAEILAARLAAMGLEGQVEVLRRHGAAHLRVTMHADDWLRATEPKRKRRG